MMNTASPSVFADNSKCVKGPVMSIDFLEEMERQILTGSPRFACPGINKNEWFFGDSADELVDRAQRTANGQRYQTHIYRLVNKKETISGSSFIVVRKFLKSGARGTSDFEWSIVDSIDAAEMLRDVSAGPTPLFGAVIERTLTPAK